MKESLPILYSFRRCPYAMRARFALVYSGIKCELREVDLKNKPQELLEISPKGTVPVLLLPDNTIIEESMDIINYALKHNDPDQWLCKDLKLLDDIVTRMDNKFISVLRKYKYYSRHPEQSKEYYLKQAEEQFIIWLEEKLRRSAYITGEKISNVDIVIFPFIRQFSLVDQEWFDNSKYNHIKQWLQSFINNPIYDIVMQKHLPWQRGDKNKVFL